MCKATRNKPKKSYKVCDYEFVRKHFLQFYIQKYSFRKYCLEKGIEDRRSALSRIAGTIELIQMKKLKRPWFAVEHVLEELFKKKENAKKGMLDKLCYDNCVLTKDEEKTIVETCRFLSVCGIEIDRDTCLDVINEVLKVRIQDKEFDSVKRGVVNRLISRNKELLGMFSGNALDPARVRQAHVDVKDALFVKLDNYIKFLYESGKVPWKSWSEVPPDAMNNMDKVATNCIDHRKKLIGDALHLRRLFQELCGDSKMPMHITLCITTKPTGK